MKANSNKKKNVFSVKPVIYIHLAQPLQKSSPMQYINIMVFVADMTICAGIYRELLTI